MGRAISLPMCSDISNNILIIFKIYRKYLKTLLFINRKEY